MVPSLNTQSCIKGLLEVHWVQDFCFWAVWAAGPVLKKKVGADYEQLLRVVFSCFQGQKKIMKKCIMQLFSADAIAFSKKLKKKFTPKT